MQPFTKTYKCGTHLFHENDHSKELYIIQSGIVRVYRRIGGRDVDLARLSKGSVLGEMALIDGKTRSACAVAGEDTTVIMIDAETFHKRIAGVPPWFLSMIRTTSEKIRKANTRLEATQLRGHCLHVVLALQYYFLRYGGADDNASGKRIDVSETSDRLVQLLSVSAQCVMDVLVALQKKSVIDLKDGSIVLCNQEKLDGCCDFLRLRFRRAFDKLATISDSAARLIVALSETVVAATTSPDKGVEIPGTRIADACAQCGETASSSKAITELKDLQILAVARGSMEKADGASEADCQFVVDPVSFKKALTYCIYKDMVPNL